MIVHVTRGHSFKGLGRYLLHDKGAKTAARVSHVETANLPTENGRAAIAHMIDTATHADQLKKAAGMKLTGNKAKPVYHLSLSWSPEEKPTQADQLAAARESIAALGMTDRQALIVLHTDTDHPHAHIVLNTVCPETGRAADTKNDRRKLSQWALAYDRRHGREHLCPERAKNEDRRRKGEWVKDQSLSRPQWMAWKKVQTKELWDQHRTETATMRPERKAQFDALWRQKQHRIETRRLEVKALYRPIWRDVFKRQRVELKAFDASFPKRLSYALQHPQGRGAGMLKALMFTGLLRRDFIRDQDAERRNIAYQQKGRINDAAREITKAWKHDRDTLRALHKAQDEARFQETKSRVDDVWKTPAPEQSTRPEFEQSKDRRQDQATRQAVEAGDQPAKKARRSAKEIMKDGQARSRGRSRSRTRRPN
jgi:hypothetical protein